MLSMRLGGNRVVYEHSEEEERRSDRFARFLEGSLILAYRFCPEIAWIPLRDGAGHCSCSAEG